MHLPGYLEGFQPPQATSPLVNATNWVNDELFWPAFLLNVGLARSAPEAFDVDLADLDIYLEKFDRPDLWPVFAVALGGGTMHLVVRNFTDDAGIDWLLDARVHATLRQLTDDGTGHPGPGLPWPLLPQEPIHLLMALPSIGDHHVPDHVPDLVAHALRAVNATTLIEDLADDLLRHRACVLLQ